jgi:RNA polymerase sigma-B factor
MAVSPSSSQAPTSAAATRSTRSQQQQTNQTLLRRLGGSRAAAARLHWRNALVSQNLGLVHMVANRESLRSGRPFDDLCSAGYEGLIRAVECFDTSRNVALSSFAVPYIQGAMRMDQRERQQPLRTPRRLRELQQRARRLQEKRQAAGQPPLSGSELAAALGCSLARLQEADAVQRALGVASLDQPLGEGTGEEQSGSWLEQISAPTPRSRDEDDSQLQWLRRQMGGLEPADRELLEARWIDGLSWSAVAERMGRDCRQCRQRAEELRRALQGASSQLEPNRARAAARAV